MTPTKKEFKEAGFKIFELSKLMSEKEMIDYVFDLQPHQNKNATIFALGNFLGYQQKCDELKGK